MKDNLTESQVQAEIAKAEHELVEPDSRAVRLGRGLKSLRHSGASHSTRLTHPSGSLPSWETDVCISTMSKVVGAGVVIMIGDR
jgi:hypothetical protein